MGRINSKNKGSTFERKIVTMLNDWVGNKEAFHRCPMSGALHWSNDKRVVSDIVPSQELIDNGWNVSIECKKVETPWEISNFLEGTSMTLKSHWRQAVEDSEREGGLIPLLVFSKNRRRIYSMMYLNVFNKLKLKDLNHIELYVDGIEVAIVDFELLLKNTNLEDFCKR